MLSLLLIRPEKHFLAALFPSLIVMELPEWWRLGFAEAGRRHMPSAKCQGHGSEQGEIGKGGQAYLETERVAHRTSLTSSLLLLLDILTSTAERGAVWIPNGREQRARRSSWKYFFLSFSSYRGKMNHVYRPPWKRITKTAGPACG